MYDDLELYRVENLNNARDIEFLLPDSKPIVPPLAKQFIDQYPLTDLVKTETGELAYVSRPPLLLSLDNNNYDFDSV